jgi:hypothetical protein
MARHPYNGKYSRRTIAKVETYARALELRVQGHSFTAIAKLLGYHDHSAAMKMMQRALDLVLKEPAEAVRALELERLDRLLEAWWPKAVRETTIDNRGTIRREAGSLEATEMVLRIIAQRARIAGVDRAIKDEREDARAVILAILKRVVSEDDTSTRTEETLAVAQWRPADVVGEAVTREALPPRLPPPPAVDEREVDYTPLETEDAEPAD